jgi:hypothetical protein
MHPAESKEWVMVMGQGLWVSTHCTTLMYTMYIEAQ